jgi:polyhydroxyalkanoate synthesis regulator phasin
MSDWAQERIDLAHQYKAMLDSGEITADECKELLEDLVRTDQVLERAEDMKRMAAVEAAVVGILSVI